jgi:hypothetical protein
MQLEEIKQTLSRKGNNNQVINDAYNYLACTLKTNPTGQSAAILANRIMYPTSDLDGARPVRIMMNLVKENK